MAESVVGLQWAYPVKRQSAYGTVTPLGDLLQTHPFEGASFIEHTPNIVDNAALLGKGHEFATRSDILTWDSMMKRQFFATTKILGWALAFHFGYKSTTTVTNGGASPSGYTTTFSHQNPNGSGYYSSGRQQPVFSVVEQVTSGIWRRFYDMQIKAVELTATLGDFLKLSVEAQGSGMKDTLTGFSFPTQVGAEGTRLRFASLNFSHGLSGSPSDQSCQVRSIRVRSEYQYFDADGYCPGSGYLTAATPSSGQVRNKLEFSKRAILFEFVMRAASADTFWTKLEAQSDLEATLTFTGSAVNGTTNHGLVITLPQMRYRAVPISSDGDLITYQVQGIIFANATDNGSGEANGTVKMTVSSDINHALLLVSS